MIIGFAGKKSSGKTTACKLLKEKGYIELNFADPLKEMAVELADIPLSHCYDLEEKERPRPMIIRVEQVLVLLAKNGITSLPKSQRGVDGFMFESLRHLLQWIGTELFREADKDFWVKKLVGKINPWKDYVIGDLRYANEAEAIKRLKGHTISIVRPGLEYKDTHASEQIQLDTDYKIINTNLNTFLNDVKVTEQLIHESEYKESR